MFSRTIVAVALLTITLPLTAATTQDSTEPRAGEHITWTGTIGDDIFSAGQSVDIDGTVEGDAVVAGGEVSVAGVMQDSVYAAGGQLNLTSDVANDLIAAGGDVRTDGHIGDNLILAGGNVRIGSEVGGKAIATGGNIRLERAAVVHGAAWLTGGNIRVEGDVSGGARLTGGQIAIVGHIAGDVEARGQDIHVGPDAKIDGKLTVFSPSEPQIDDGASIGGRVDYQKTERGPNWIMAAVIGAVVLTLIIYFYLFIVGMLMILICPGFVRRNAEILRQQGFVAFGIGALVVLVTPILLVILVVTVIGIPFALLAALLYGAALMLCIPFVGTTLAHWIAGRKGAVVSRGRLILLYAGVLTVFWIVGLIPLLGGLIWILLTMLGLGVVTLQTLPMFNRMRGGIEPG